MVSRLVQQQPLIAEGLDRLALPASKIPFGSLNPETQRAIFTRGTNVPLYRNQIAQFLKGVRRNRPAFSGNPWYYPESQYVNLQMPGMVRPVPAHFPGYMDFTLTGRGQQPLLTPQYNFQGLNRGSTFTGETLAQKGIPTPDLPSFEQWQQWKRL
jgi:hypothetical protein